MRHLSGQKRHQLRWRLLRENLLDHVDKDLMMQRLFQRGLVVQHHADGVIDRVQIWPLVGVHNQCRGQLAMKHVDG